MIRSWKRGVLAASLVLSLSACVPVLVGSAVVGTTAVATDRRTAGMQLEDQSIELRVRNLVDTEYGDKLRVTPSSYNGVVLLLGNAPDEATRDRFGKEVAAIANVREVINRIEVGLPRTVGAAANDSLITGQVRAALIGTPDLASNALVITTYRNTVYLQGRVTEAEGKLAAQVASGLKGVNRVVTAFEYIDPEEAASYVNTAPPAGFNTSGTELSQSQSIRAPAAAAPAPAPAPGTGVAVQPVPGPSPALAIPIPSAD